jgi:cytochrome c556
MKEDEIVRMSKVGTVALIALVASAVAAEADLDTILKRKKILKSIGEATRPVALMLKGSQPFDLATVDATLAKYSEGAKALPALFPPDSMRGGETEALPAIWDDKTKFNALFAKLDTDAAAASLVIKDEASFRATIPKVLSSCKSCHDTFRDTN